MLSRKALVFIVVGVVIVIGVVLAIVLGSKSKPSPSPPPPRPTPPNPRPPGPVPCNCPPDQECNSAGKCIPKGQCGPKTVPSGQHCPVDKLTCDSVTNKWRCNGTCDSGWFGTNCEKHTDDSYTLYLVQPQVLDSKTYYSDIDYFEGRTKPQDSELANWNVDNQWKFYNNLNMIAQQFNKFATYFLKNKSLSSVQAKIKSAGGDSNGATFSARKDGGCSGYTGVITASNGANLYPATTFTFGDLSPTVTLKNDSNPYELYLLTPQGYETYKNDIKRVTSTVKDKIFNPSPDQVVHYDIDDQIWTESDDTNKIGTQVNDFVSYHLGHVNNFYVNGVLRTSGGSANGKYFRARRLDQQPDQYKISFYNSKDDVTDTRGLPCEAWCGGKINASRFAC